MPRSKQTAHAELDELRQQAAAERVRHRELQAEMEAAKLAVEQAGAAIAEGYAAEDQRAVAASRKAEGAAVAKVKDLQHRLTGAEIRVDRAQREADTFAEEHARDLLEERAADARELALNLTRADTRWSGCIATTSRCARTSTRWSGLSRTPSLAPMDLHPPTRGSTN